MCIRDSPTPTPNPNPGPHPNPSPNPTQDPGPHPQPHPKQEPGPDLIVLDEGHRIKNMLGKLHEALRGVRTRRRLILTGTPMQNNLMEYHAMVGFGT